MRPRAYYNEIDPYAAEWLRNLIREGHIAPGDVDDRSILDVDPVDLVGYNQCHFFAGVGVWSYALRRAGWPDDRSVWTGSCPCQPFSAAGKKGGFDDERHLWPAFFKLIAAHRPVTVFGEQVASKDGLAWLDLVCSDLEAADYACWPVDLCAAGVGAPHIRQRLWWVADYASGLRRVADAADERHEWGGSARRRGLGFADVCAAGGLADADGGHTGTEGLQRGGEHGQQPEDGGTLCRLGHADRERRDGQPVCLQRGRPQQDRAEAAGAGAACVARPQGLVERRLSADQWSTWTSGVVGGHWQNADLIYCRDEKWRPVEPGTFPLAHGAPARVGRLRAYGNAIVAEAAAELIGAYLTVSS